MHGAGTAVMPCPPRPVPPSTAHSVALTSSDCRDLREKPGKAAESGPGETGRVSVGGRGIFGIGIESKI